MMHPKASPKSNTATDAVDALLAALEHPNKAGVQLLREAILRVDSRIREEVKWNAPSFMLEDHFATFKLHPPGNIQLVLHTGAKPKKPPQKFALKGAEKLVKWAAPDRCVVSLGNTESAREHCQLVASLVQQWVQQLQST
jgi:hypothetical protein